MDWRTGEGEVELAVAVFSSTTDGPAADPVIYLDGGPGSHSLETITFVVEDFINPLAERGDVIFFDQRGTGQTTPRLECTETTAVSRELEDDPSISDDVSIDLFHQALEECQDRLTGDGVDLSDYNSINNAHDVEALRLALGYEEFNLFGVSYGTKLGLEVLRQHPDGVRSAILDSVYPPQVDSVLENPGTFIDSYQLVVAACAAEEACAEQGDLAGRVRAVIAQYEADPVRVEIRDWISNTTDEVYVTGETIVGIIVGALYSASQFTDIPELITELENGETSAVTAFLGQDRTTERFFSNGMFYAFACNEEISFADPDQVADAIPADPFGLKDSFDFASNTGNLAFGTCAAFNSGQAPASSNEAVASDVPSLLLAGTYDPVTPVSWAERAAESLSNSTLVVAPYLSHGVSSDPCGMSVVLEYLDKLSGPLETGCLNDQELEFLSSGAASVELETVTYRIEDFGVEISTVRPTDWSVGSLSGDQYRRRSFLDATELYQLGGNPALASLLAEFIEDEQEVTLSDAERFTSDVALPFESGDIPGEWERRSARSGSAAVEWFQSVTDDGQLVLVALVASADEIDALIPTVLQPALEAIDVRSL